MSQEKLHQERSTKGEKSHCCQTKHDVQIKHLLPDAELFFIKTSSQPGLKPLPGMETTKAE